MGYASRRQIYDGIPHPVESRFEMPSSLCPLVSTKHKNMPSVSIGRYSSRVCFTDKLSGPQAGMNKKQSPEA